MRFLNNYSFTFWRGRFELRIWRTDRKPRIDFLDWKYPGKAYIGKF